MNYTPRPNERRRLSVVNGEIITAQRHIPRRTMKKKMMTGLMGMLSQDLRLGLDRISGHRQRLQRDMLRRWGNRDDVASSSTGEGVMEMKMVVRHRDLKGIVDSIKENFDKAAVAGDQVSEMLEISKAQLDRSFRQLRKTVYHSNSLLSSLSSTWTSKPPLAVKYQLEPGLLDEQGGLKSLCSSLERLLAWEKKLYDEVKSREGVKIEHEKKLSALQSQEYKGDDEA